MTTVIKSKEESIRIVPFSGKQSDWDAWEAKFMMRIAVKKLDDFFLEERTIPTKTQKTFLTESEVDKVLLSNYEMNCKAYSELLQSMDTSTDAGLVAFTIVKKYRTKDHPYGNAYLAWESLKKKYAPVSAPTLIKTSKEFYQSRLEKGGDPDIYITKMESLRIKMDEMDPDNGMTDSQFMVVILNNLPKEYENQVERLEELLEQDDLDIEKIRTVLNVRLIRLKDSKQTSNTDSDEKALLSYTKKYKGKCTYCGKLGHKGADCYSNPNNKKSKNNHDGNDKSNDKPKKFLGKCFYCKKEGHRESNCFKKKKDNGGNDGNQGDEIALLTYSDDIHFGKLYSPNEDNGEEDYVKCRRHYDKHDYDFCFIAMDRDEFEGDEEDEKQMIHDYDSDNSGEILYGSHNVQAVSQIQVPDPDPEYIDIEAARTAARVRYVNLTNDFIMDTVTKGNQYGENMDQAKKYAMWNHTHDEDDAINEENELYQFFEMIGMWAYSMNPQKCVKYASDMTKLLRTNDIDNVYTLLLNVIRLPYLCGVTNKDKFDPTTMDHIVFYGMEWLCMKKTEFVMTHPNQGALLDEYRYPPGAIGNLSQAFDSLENYDRALMSVDWKSDDVRERNRNTWIADSGCSCHMTNSKENMCDTRPNNTRIYVGDGKSYLRSELIGTKRITLLQQDGTRTPIVLHDVKYVPDLASNLISITKVLERGWNIDNVGNIIRLKSKQGDEILFDKVIHTGTGVLMGVEMVIAYDESYYMIDGKKIIDIDVNRYHAILGHPSLVTTRFTAKRYNIKLTGEYQPCRHCAIAKAKQKVTTTTDVSNKSKTPGERIMFDLASVQDASIGGSRYWLLVVDEASDYSWSLFLRNKDEVTSLMNRVLKALKVGGRTVKYIRSDNAGENIAFQKFCVENYTEIKYELTSPGTPQQNGQVERKFATLFAKDRASLHAAKLPVDLRRGLWAESAVHVTELENILVTYNDPESAYFKFYRKDPKAFEPLHPFGEIVIVFDHANRLIRSKLDDRGYPGIFIGRAKSHGTDVIRVLRLSTRRIVCTRDVQWMNTYYGNWLTQEGSPLDPFVLTDETQGIEQQLIPIRTDEPQEQPEPTDIIDVTNVLDENLHDNATLGPVEQEIRDRYAISNTIGLTNTPTETSTIIEEGGDTSLPTSIATEIHDATMEEQVNLLIDRLPEDFMPFHDVAFTTYDSKVSLEDVKNMSPSVYKDFIEIPKTFEEAWNHPIPWIRAKFREAIRKEHLKMKIHKVWIKVKRESMDRGRVAIKYRWVFEIKRDGTFRARLVACGYSQVAGIDFSDVYSPVVNDVAFRMAIILQIAKQYDSRVIDIETAFLHGSLDEKIYMECPDGLPHEKDEVLLLQRSIYGLVQSARQFYKKLICILELIGFVQSSCEPCLLFRKGKLGDVYMVIHVDDCYMVGDSAALDESIELIKTKGKLNVKVEHNTNDYLSCEILFSKDHSRAWMGQPFLMKKIINNFSNLITSNIRFRTPGTPGLCIIRPKDDEPIEGEDEQKLYRSVVGSLLHLVKYSRPDLSNSVRELSKCSGVATPTAYKEMLRVLKFAIDTQDFGLKMIPKVMNDEEIELEVYSDSDWAGDKETRQSVTGYIIYMIGIPIMWKSKSQKCIALSSSEAEYVAISEAVKELVFVVQMLETIGIKVKRPVSVYCDNTGAMFMVENNSATSRTKHIDIRYHFVRSLIKTNLITINFVKSGANESDPFTKNVQADIYDRRCNDVIMKKGELKKD